MGDHPLFIHDFSTKIFPKSSLGYFLFLQNYDKMILSLEVGMQRRYLALLLGLCLLWTLIPVQSFAENPMVLKQTDAVLVYNPMLSPDAKLYTGTFSEKEVTEESVALTVKQNYLSGLHTPVDTKRTPALSHEGERTFWVCVDLDEMSYENQVFSLGVQTDHAAFWISKTDRESVSDEILLKLADTYESVIYPTLTTTFGTFRDLGGDGRIHVLIYDMNSSGVCGFFDRYDLYSMEEIALIDPDSDAYNALPIINVNAEMASYEELIASTVAHEFQHLIHMSAVLASSVNKSLLGEEIQTDLWLNEAFSMEAEELCFSGSVVRQGYLESYSTSRRMQNGQSLYDFSVGSTDVGAYGQSFLFARYMRAQVGENAFSMFLRYWETATEADALTDAKALYAVQTESFTDGLASIVYEPFVSNALGGYENEAMSKWNLAYRLSLLLQAEEGIYHHPDQPVIPYYTGTGTHLCGGGAVVIQTNGTDFSIPIDADAGLIFVGIKDGTIAEWYTVPQTENGFYILSAEYNGRHLALGTDQTEGIISVSTAMNEIISSKELTTGNTNGYLWYLEGDPFFGYVLWNTESDEKCHLGRLDSNREELSITEAKSSFRMGKFLDGTEKLQFDGVSGRAILFSSMKHGYGYFTSGFFMNDSFARPKLHPVTVFYGDVNRNDLLEAADAAMILRGIVGLENWNEVERLCADVNQDTEVNATDAAALLRALVGQKEV